MRKRYGAVLLHISSLDSDFGTGTLGAPAHRFLDFLEKSGFCAWQMLPINPIGEGYSPYSSPSSFAGNPLFIDPVELFSEGLITQAELSYFCLPNDGRVSFEDVLYKNTNLLRTAFSRFQENSDIKEFTEREKAWLLPYAAFMSYRSGFEKEYYLFEQFVFQRQWQKLRCSAKEKGISLIGDIPMYVSPEGSDVFSYPDIFNSDEVSGCPPDAFSSDGQLWGMPTYRWDKLKETDYSWWVLRLLRAAALFDTVRLDHFRAFEAYWAIPKSCESAACGMWKKGPGIDFFRTVKKRVPDLDMIAEDLGFLTDEVFRLRDEAGLYGMRVFQFADFSSDENIYLPHMYPASSVAYTGTHDNDTLAGFFSSCDEKTRRLAARYLDAEREADLVPLAISAVWNSRSDIATAQIQDFLMLGSEARMNIPSKLNDANWRFRIKDEFLTEELSESLFSLNRSAGRI